jgi:hypothetical protein
MSIVIGIDNGTSGSYSIISPKYVTFGSMPTKKSILGKQERVITRIDVKQLKLTLVSGMDGKAYIERPFTGRFINAMLPAQRAFEAVLITLEQLGIPYEVIDSKVWQKPLLGGVKGSENLKLASRLKGIELYPDLKDVILDHGDADGLLIAHHFATLTT